MFITFVGSPILQDYLFFYREQVELSFSGKKSLKRGIIVKYFYTAQKENNLSFAKFDKSYFCTAQTLMLGKIEGGRRRGWQRMRRLDGTTDSMHMGLSKLRSW